MCLVRELILAPSWMRAPRWTWTTTIRAGKCLTTCAPNGLRAQDPAALPRKPTFSAPTDPDASRPPTATPVHSSALPRRGPMVPARLPSAQMTTPQAHPIHADSARITSHTATGLPSVVIPLATLLPPPPVAEIPLAGARRETAGEVERGDPSSALLTKSHASSTVFRHVCPEPLFLRVEETTIPSTAPQMAPIRTQHSATHGCEFSPPQNLISWPSWAPLRVTPVPVCRALPRA